MGGFAIEHILLFLVIGVLLFGRRLPEIGRSLGKTVIEFKKGIAGIEDQIHTGQDTRPAIEPESVRPPQRIPSTAPRFEDAPQPGLPPQV